MSERVHGNTMEILARVAAGHSVKSIADSLGITTNSVYVCQKRHPDILNRIKHQKADGTPDVFPPGHGCESVKHIEQPVENPVEKPATEQPRHSFGELFEKIKRLENRNKELEEQLQEKSQEKAAEPFKQSDLLRFMVARTLNENTTKEEIMGIASVIDFMNGSPNQFIVISPEV